MHMLSWRFPESTKFRRTNKELTLAYFQKLWHVHRIPCQEGFNKSLPEEPVRVRNQKPILDVPESSGTIPDFSMLGSPINFYTLAWSTSLYVGGQF